MNHRKKLLIFIIFVFITILSISIFLIIKNKFTTNTSNSYLFQNNTPGVYTERTAKIKLTSPKEARLAYYETPNVIIGFSYNEFNIFLQKEKQIYENNPPDPSRPWVIDSMNQINHFYLLINNAGSGNVTIRANDLKNNEKKFMDSWTAKYLKIGSCTVFDKQTSKYLDYILQVNYNNDCGPLCGATGEIYKTPQGIEIYTIMTSIR